MYFEKYKIIFARANNLRSQAGRSTTIHSTGFWFGLKIVTHVVFHELMVKMASKINIEIQKTNNKQDLAHATTFQPSAVNNTYYILYVSRRPWIYCWWTSLDGDGEGGGKAIDLPSFVPIFSPCSYSAPWHKQRWYIIGKQPNKTLRPNNVKWTAEIS
jgi:hypothetical protein